MNYGLGVIMMGQCRFINGTNAPLWWGTLTMGEAGRVWGQEVYEKSLYLLNFAMNLKLF